MITSDKNKSRLRVVLVVALSLGATSATLSGTLAALGGPPAEAAVA